MLRWLPRAAGGSDLAGVRADIGVPRAVIDDAVAAAGRQPKRSDGKLLPHVMIYFAAVMGPFADENYQVAANRVAGRRARLSRVTPPSCLTALFTASPPL